MNRSESEIDQLLAIEAAKHGLVLLRNNVGAFSDVTGRHVRFGLGNDSKKKAEVFASSDRIGIMPVVITQAMVGQVVGVFTAVEVKKEDWNPDKKLDKHEQAQKNFIDWVVARGGFAGFANSIDSLKRILRV